MFKWRILTPETKFYKSAYVIKKNRTEQRYEENRKKLNTPPVCYTPGAKDSTST